MNNSYTTTKNYATQKYFSTSVTAIQYVFIDSQLIAQLIINSNVRLIIQLAVS